MLRSRWWLLLAVVFLGACRFGGVDPAGDLDPAPDRDRVLAIAPAHALLYLAPDGEGPGLYPSSQRFAVSETKDGQSVPVSETLRWESSDPAIALAEVDGTVRAIATGSVEIRVRTLTTPAFEATASVIVKDGGRADVILE